MKNNLLIDVKNLGQSLWLDFISSKLLTSGELDELIEDGLMGLTSNPAIFEQAISKTNDYDDNILALKEQGCIDPKLIYEALAIDDIKKACDKFAHVYEQTNKTDGFVSLELDPSLAFDVAGSVAEAKRLHKSINRKNLMIKVPATPEGIKVIYELILLGMNVNVTLLFSVEAYKNANNAYIDAIKERIKKGLEISHINSVASFFLSRIDTKADKLLETKGKLALMNAKKAYLEFMNFYDQTEIKELLNKGLNPQRLLWASTSTKNPEYDDLLYVQNLIGKHTVNTIPPSTLKIFMQKGKSCITVLDDSEKIIDFFKDLEKQGINIDCITDELLDEGLDIFKKAFMNLLESVNLKALSLQKKN